MIRMETDYAASVTELLEELATYGAEKKGGITRLLYSKAWSQAQSFLAGKMTEAGLEVRYDSVGNLFGRFEGKSQEAKVILCGSHIDTVRSGGKFDGAYGIAAALTAVRFLKETYGTPVRHIEVVSFCEEEGSRFPLAYWGSGNVIGFHKPELAESITDSNEISLKQAMEDAGYGKADQPDPFRKDLYAFIEVHIEQGITLERTGDRIGIVDTIAGQRRYVITVNGETNHAGTTPMSMRKDALAASAEMIHTLEKVAVKAGEPLVATVGSMNIQTNIPNVISGSVEFTLDIRHISETLLTGFCDAVIGMFQVIAARRNVEIDIVTALRSRPTPMDLVLAGRLERICSDNSYSYRRMMSGAGHDAQMFGPVCPTAMIFVPSKDGISHSPDEYTKPEDLQAGVAVLAEMLYELAYEE